MKRKTAKEVLAITLKELAEEKTLDKISVSEIVQESGYSTATFYRHFKDKYDLADWIYSNEISWIIDTYLVKEQSWSKLLSAVSDYYVDNKKYLTNFVRSADGYSPFLTSMFRISHSLFHKAFCGVSGVSKLDNETEIIMLSYVYGCILLTYEWLLGIDLLEKVKLSQAYVITFPEQLRRYIDK
jgi:AcrR family transcriptional regulator